MSSLPRLRDFGICLPSDRHLSAAGRGAGCTLRFALLPSECGFETSIKDQKTCANYPFSLVWRPSAFLQDATPRAGGRSLVRAPVRLSRMQLTRISSRGLRLAPLLAEQAVTLVSADRAGAETFRARFGVTHRQVKMSPGFPIPVAFLCLDTLMPPGTMQAAEAAQRRHPGRGEGYACSRRY